MSQSDIIMLVPTGVIFGIAAFFAFFTSRIAEDEAAYRAKEIGLLLTMAEQLNTFNLSLNKIDNIARSMDSLHEKENNIYDICDRIEQLVSSLGSSTMRPGGLDSGESGDEELDYNKVPGEGPWFFSD